MTVALHRRQFLSATASAFAALSVSGCMMRGGGVASAGGFTGYGPLVTDPEGLLDLPQGFSYRVLSRLGDTMDDGFKVPDRADGMGCFDIGNGEIALVRNHELMPSADAGGDLPVGYDRVAGKAVIGGGTTTLVLDAKTLAKKREFRSLAGTIRNCSGGITPWGSWLTCEEFVTEAKHIAPDKLGKDHGWVFEVPAAANGLVDAPPLKGLGRFNHEAACVDPRTGIVYETEDREDGVFYRFIPHRPGDLAAGGRLQAMVIVDGPADTRNWDSPALPVRAQKTVRWVDLEDADAPADDLRQRAAAKGAALVARGEGIHMGDGDLYLCATNGGAKKLGQIFRLIPGLDGADDRFELFFESENEAQFNYGDNLTVAANGHLVVCEDQYTDVVDNHIKGITPQGTSYDIARLIQQTELAGACFSPDGRTLFVNAYAPTRTLAITGPWAA